MAVLVASAAVLAFPAGKAQAQNQPMFSVSPRFYMTWIEPSEFNEPFALPLLGLSASVAPIPQWDFTVNGLWGESDSDFRDIATTGAQFDGDGYTELERLDLEVLARYRIPSSPAYVVGGFRYVKVDEEFFVDRPGVGGGCAGGCFAAGLVDTVENEFWLAEVGGGFATRLSQSGRHSLFGNLLFGFGQASTEETLSNGTAACGAACVGHFEEDGFAFLVDTNVGYQYAISSWISLSARYRLIGVQNGSDRTRPNTGRTESNLTLVHGPEIAATFRF